jgi:hypothetical protein
MTDRKRFPPGWVDKKAGGERVGDMGAFEDVITML